MMLRLLFSTAIGLATQGLFAQAPDSLSPLPFNTDRDDYAASFPGNNQLIFTSNRDVRFATKRSSAAAERNYAKLYAAGYRTDGASAKWDRQPVLLPAIDNAHFHESASACSPDGKTYWRTANQTNNAPGRPARLGLFFNTAGEGWQAFAWNSPDYDLAHPALSPNGRRLFFAANMPLGYGGMDLYVSTWENNHWSTPQNLGPKVNTSGNEVFPYADAQRRLFFASDGQPGQGGLDLFCTVYHWEDDWVKPVALPAPFNSAADDFGLTESPDSTWGVISSNRAGGKGGDDLYRFSTRLLPFPSIPVAAPPPARITLQGLVFDLNNGLPAGGIPVMLNEINSKDKPKTGTTLGDGRFQFELDINHCYSVRAAPRGFLAAVSDTICTGREWRDQTFRTDLMLQPYRSDSLPWNDSTAVLRSPFVFNGDTGLYETRDGMPANQSLGNGLEIKNGVLFDRGEPRQPAAGRWTPSPGGNGFLVKVFYDFDEEFGRTESNDDLEKLLQTLMENPTVRVEIASHTDARGQADYNFLLSQRRAEKIAEWLATQGIDRKRLVAKGYGETQLLNRCRDGVPCSVLEHAENRRTEFRILDR